MQTKRPVNQIRRLLIAQAHADNPGTEESEWLDGALLYIDKTLTQLKLRHAGAIRQKCEQYWNEHNISDEEIHAILEFIHRETRP